MKDVSVFFVTPISRKKCEVRLTPEGNTGSAVSTEVKPRWTGLITGWVIIWEISRGVLLEESGWRSAHESRLPPLLQMLYVGWVSVHLNQTSSVFSGRSGFFPHQKPTHAVLASWVVPSGIIIYEMKMIMASCKHQTKRHSFLQVTFACLNKLKTVKKKKGRKMVWHTPKIWWTWYQQQTLYNCQ